MPESRSYFDIPFTREGGLAHRAFEGLCRSSSPRLGLDLSTKWKALRTLGR